MQLMLYDPFRGSAPSDVPLNLVRKSALATDQCEQRSPHVTLTVFPNIVHLYTTQLDQTSLITRRRHVANHTQRTVMQLVAFYPTRVATTIIRLLPD